MLMELKIGLLFLQNSKMRNTTVHRWWSYIKFHFASGVTHPE